MFFFPDSIHLKLFQTVNYIFSVIVILSGLLRPKHIRSASQTDSVVSSFFIFPAGSCFLYDKLDSIIIHYLNYIFTHPVSARSSFICFVLQHKLRKPPPPHFSQLLTDWINSTVQRVHWGGFIGLWNQREQCSWPQSGVRQRYGGHQGLHQAPLDGQAGNCKPGRPGARALRVYLGAFISDVTTL